MRRLLKFLKRIRRFTVEDFVFYMRAPDKKGLGQQWRDLKYLYRCYGIPPYQYITHALYLQEFQGDIGCFLPPELLRRFRDSLNPRQCWVNAVDKQKFVALMMRANLPVVKVLARITRERHIVTLDGNGCSFQQLLSWLFDSGQGEIFLKPQTSGSGMGAFRAKVVGDHLLIDSLEIDEDKFFTMLFANGRYDCYLVQPLIIQHPLLHNINPSSVNTIRIDTLVIGDNIVHNGAYSRIGAGTSHVDNSSQGGLWCAIDLETGKLAPTAMTMTKFGRHSFRTHPVTGCKFEEITLPYWEETKQLVCSGARMLLPMRSLGWDVAITEHGPVLVETNQDYMIALLQEAVQGLRDTPLGRQAIACFSRQISSPASES
jgi:hypothetical protein